jgi:SSS family solute:Na+ symporter
MWLEIIHPGREQDEKRLLALSRIVTVAVGLCALLIGVSLPGIVGALIYSYTMYTAGVLVPVLGGVLWKRGTREGALAAILAGSIVALAGLTTGFKIQGIPVEIYAALVSAAVYVVVSLLTRRTVTGGPEEKISH